MSHSHSERFRLRARGARVRLDVYFMGIFTGFFEAMPIATVSESLRRFAPLVAWLLIFSVAPRHVFAQAQGVPRAPGPGEGLTAILEADQQRQVGKTFIADGHVDIRYGTLRLRADHVEYHGETQMVSAQGHVQLDYQTQHLEAESAQYDLRTGQGSFHRVRATFTIQRRPTPTLLVSPNPLYFEAEEAERVDDHTYRVRKAWMTVCDPGRPTWKFYAPEATVELRKSVHLENGNFRVHSVPVMYFPYATFPAEKRRDSGFMIPDIGHSSQKGLVLGESIYWAPTDWMDATVGAAYFSLRGWSQNADLRIRPWENARLDATYYGVMDRGLPQPTGPPINQGGHEEHVGFTALLPDGWRAVADLNQLSSLTFRLAFSETYSQAINSEVRNTAFLTNNFRGFSLNFAARSYENFLSTSPQSSITLRAAPEGRFSSVDQAPFRQFPVYFSFETFTDAVHKGETVTPFATPGYVGRSELAPSVTMPFHWGPWLDVTPSFTLRSTYYGGQLQNGAFLGQGFFRTTEEFSLDLRPPTLERVWSRGDTKWKHVIEPDIVYNYVNGVNDYARFIRFDEDETLTDTNEFEYGFTQRLYRRPGTGDAEEVVSWRLVQKYYFNSTFGGALVPGQRNVFQALDSLTPFAFADQARSYSPIVSDLRVMPGKRFDVQFRVDFDPKRAQLTAIGTLVKLKPYKASFVTLAHFSEVNLPTPPSQNPPNFVFLPRSNQIRALIGFGDLTRRGWNGAVGASYDITQDEFQNQVVQLSYNGKCCGIGLEYRRLELGAVRTENQFRIVILIANIGSVGNLRRQEKIF